MTVRRGLWAAQLGLALAACVREPTSTTPPAVASVDITPGAASLAAGAFLQLTATPRDSAGAAVGGVAITWRSDQPSVATVTPTGLVTAVAVGSANITATVAGHGATAAMTVGGMIMDGVSCLDVGGPLMVLTGPQSAYEPRGLADSARVDARQASWVDVGPKPVRVSAGPGLCFSGGVIQGSYADTVSWTTMHETYGLQVAGPLPTVEAVRIHDYGDGISLGENADGWTIRGAHLSFVRDDCIENDYLWNGLIDDVLFDGCYVGYSARTYGNLPETLDRSANVVTVRRTLWRLQLMPTVYEGPAPAHLGFFKLDKDGTSPRFALHDNVFFPAMLAGSSGMFMWPPADKIASCSNNVVVWLGAGDFPLPAGLPVGCVTVVRDQAVWDTAVAAWLTRHGEP